MASLFRRSHGLLLAGAALAACAAIPDREAGSVWDRAAARGVDFRAIGQEPGWLVDIEDGERITVVTDYGERRAVLPAPEPVRRATGTTYRAATDAHTLTVTIEESPCRDAMSGEAFPATVAIRLDGRDYRGCGRPLP